MKDCLKNNVFRPKVRVKMPVWWLGLVFGLKAFTLPFDFAQTGFLTVTLTQNHDHFHRLCLPAVVRPASRQTGVITLSYKNLFRIWNFIFISRHVY